MEHDKTQNAFEQELRRAMRRGEPPVGFTDRVMREVAATRSGVSVGRAWQMPHRMATWRWIGGALAASLLAGSMGTWAEAEHRRRKQREAERQFALAMQVTSHALEQTRQQLGRAGFKILN